MQSSTMVQNQAPRQTRRWSQDRGGVRRRRRERSLPYVAVAFGVTVMVSTLMVATLDAVAGPVDTTGLRRQLGVSAHTNESCLPREGLETDSPILACLLYTLGILVCFLGLAVLCDEFFESSLMVISMELKLSKDVAGATFMAAGGSAPELFTSLLTCMTTQSSAGVGTILGSAVFNLVVIISLSSLVCPGHLLIDYRPCVCFRHFSFAMLSPLERLNSGMSRGAVSHSVIRDSVAYSISIVTMAVCAMTPVSSELPELDGKSGFSFWEALIMTVMYIGYIFIMSKNDKVMAMIGSPPPGFDGHSVDSVAEEPESDPETAHNPLASVKQKASAVKNSFRSSVSEDSKAGDLGRSLSRDAENSQPGALPTAGASFEQEVKQSPEQEDGGFFSLVSKPFVNVFSVTVPPCDDDEWEVGQAGGAKYYWGAFTMCIVWIGLLTLAMVAWADRLGCILGINSFLMGLVVLAAGTSVPDALASVAVARDGEGGMAVSNAIGSNVFDILLGLGLPFMVYCAVWGKAGYASGDEVEVLVACIQLQVILFIVVLAMWVSKWRLSSNLGGALMLLYFFYVGFNIVRVS